MKKQLILLGLIIIGNTMFVGCDKTQESAFENVEVEYGGPDGLGDVVAIKNIEGNIQYLAAKKAGYSDSQAEEIRDDSYYTDRANKFDKSKTADYNKYRDVKITVIKQEKLSNGEKILVKVNPVEKDGPIKSEEKEFTVSNLPSKYYSIGSVLNEVEKYPIKFVKSKGLSGEDIIELNYVPYFSGKNGKENVFNIEELNGKVVRPSSIFSLNTKEGDNCVIKLSPEYLEYKKEQGYILKGENRIIQKIVCTPRFE
ncbi:hypothetical protein [Lactococcus sp. DD01]|uniref:hypothetical protein n=1 Tax=Lactococcus sp. DD01 TaxID=1776443 RepID=UPI0007763AE3|nr:hypothetical protein [Lactococcus sp. DD01]KXT63533.1 hypothetical protein LACDD01_00013 [Lactococcus sp. DD01]